MRRLRGQEVSGGAEGRVLGKGVSSRVCRVEWCEGVVVRRLRVSALAHALANAEEGRLQ